MGAACSSDSAVLRTDVAPPPPVGTSRHTLHRSNSGRSDWRATFRRSNPSEPSHRRNGEAREVERLQIELAAMEALFQSLLGQAYREMQADAENAGPPPASAQAIRRLPTVVVAAEDLIEETNRQCSVCFSDCHVGHRMARLPCGHLFHGACVAPWLYKRCTCPVCRYELQTDSSEYEPGRIERMRERRPRLRMHELDRMKVRELRDLAFQRLNISQHGDILTDKSDLINRIVESGQVDIVASPDPVEYQLSGLRSMGVGALRREMAKAGVFFDPVDVLEKEDMVQLFILSGRVALIESGSSSSDSEGNDSASDSNSPSLESSRKRSAEEISSTKHKDLIVSVDVTQSASSEGRGLQVQVNDESGETSTPGNLNRISEEGGVGMVDLEGSPTEVSGEAEEARNGGSLDVNDGMGQDLPVE